MLERTALIQLEASLDVFPVVALLGPRQVGKTTLAHAVAEAAARLSVAESDVQSQFTDRCRAASLLVEICEGGRLCQR